MTPSDGARRPPFLTARWEYLLMLNYEVDPAALAPFVPAGTELDRWNGGTLVSVVGFRFRETRVLGLSIPFHTDFEEVNLRFYVRRECAGESRRGVVFVKEMVPRRAIAAIARAVYQENYVALRMRHRIQLGSSPMAPSSIAYGWRADGRWEGMSAEIAGAPEALREGSEAQFITEHYWGYTAQRDGGCVEYRVEHPPWRVWTPSRPALQCDIARRYGAAFVAALSAPPRSAFVAEGSNVIVRRGVRL
jgi:uncharacterized protein YqjF (DUF2071 family)